MSRATQRREGRGRSQRWMLLLFLLLPGGVALGLLAPELVRMAPAEEVVLAQEGGPVFRAPPLYKQPLLVPRQFSSGFTPALLDLEELFSRTAGGPSEAQLGRMVAFPQNTGELIALDEVSEQLKQASFKDVLAAAIVPRSELPGPSQFLPLVNPIPRGNDFIIDDFPGPGGADALTTPIPEPGSALLLALGLLGIAGVRRRLTR